MAKVGRASRTAFRRTSRPPEERRRALHPERYLSVFEMSGANAARRSFSAERGNPK
jgi:hypothetical protein